MDGAFDRPPRGRVRTDELPPGAREEIDALLADGASYQDVADALEGYGLAVAKGDIGRYEARLNGDRREERLLNQQIEALSLLVGKLSDRLRSDSISFDKLPADKAVSGLIQAARAVAQVEKLAGDRKKKKAAARVEVVAELRKALLWQPELLDRIEALVSAQDGGQEC